MSDKIWTTYRMEDGSQIWGDFAWVEHEEFFEGVTEPTHVIKETWTLAESERVTFKPSYWDEEEYEEYEEFHPIPNKIYEEE